MALLNTVGLEMPDEFPSNILWRTHERVTHALGTGSAAWREFGGGWNGMAYRFLDSSEYSAAFMGSIREHGMAPPADERFRQESALFGFFVSGLSSLECFVYGLHALAWGAAGEPFAMDTDEQKRGVTIRSTTKRLREAFPDDRISADLTALQEDARFIEWSEFRNVLAHRTAPGRAIEIEIGGASDGSRSGSWRELPLDDRLTEQRLSWLGGWLATLIGSAETFAEDHVG